MGIKWPNLLINKQTLLMCLWAWKLTKFFGLNFYTTFLCEISEKFSVKFRPKWGDKFLALMAANFKPTPPKYQQMSFWRFKSWKMEKKTYGLIALGGKPSAPPRPTWGRPSPVNLVNSKLTSCNNKTSHAPTRSGAGYSASMIPMNVLV